MQSVLAHAAHALRNAFFSAGTRRRGARFSAEYLRFALESARRWGDSGPGTMRVAGRELRFFNRQNALHLMHEIFVSEAYAPSACGGSPWILDCGANIGVAVVFFKTVCPGARVTAFEPAPAAFQRLRENVGDYPGVELREAAVAGTAGTLTFYTDPANPGGVNASMHAQVGGPSAHTVRAVRLSDVIDAPVDYLKLDVEGAEFEVVDDLVGTGAIRQVREGAIEFHRDGAAPDAPERMAAALRGAGFAVTGDLSPRIGMVYLRREG